MDQTAQWERKEAALEGQLAEVMSTSLTYIRYTAVHCDDNRNSKAEARIASHSILLKTCFVLFIIEYSIPY